MPAPTGQLKRTSQAYDADADFFTPRVTIAATTATNAIEFDVIPQGAYKAQVFNGAYTGYVAGTAEWSVEFQVANAAAGPWVTINSTPLNGADGDTADISLSGKEVQQAVPDAAFARLNAVLTGAAGPLSYEASIVPCY